jgi:hypothetical protein
MIFFQEIHYIIWSNVYVDHMDWIASDFELKIKNRSGLEFDLNSIEFLEFDLI